MLAGDLADQVVAEVLPALVVWRLTLAGWRSDPDLLGPEPGDPVETTPAAIGGVRWALLR